MTKRTYREISATSSKVFQGLFALMFLFSLLGAQPVRQVAAQTEFAWVAYNDVVYQSGQPETNITKYTISSQGTASGDLVDYTTGTALTGRQVAITTSGSVNYSGGGSYDGTESAETTDAYTTFHGIVNPIGLIQWTSNTPYLDLTFSGLDSGKTYTFATTANRAGGSSYASRLTKFTISGIDTATNASTAGVTENGTYEVQFSTGENTTTGYVARWTGIQPIDGGFKVRVQGASSGTSYGPSVFMLAEEAPTGPTITTSVSELLPFRTQPETPSDPQTYKVSGVNLTNDIDIGAPDGFEISTDGSTWLGGLTLNESGGTVSETTIYVRMTGAAEGEFSGNIAHVSTPAVTKNVAVTGNVSLCYDVSLVAVADTRIRSSQATTNYGSETTVTMSPFSTSPQGGLFKWDLSSVPAGITVDSASLSFFVTDASVRQFGLYELRREWGESTATWNSTGTTNWTTEGAASTTGDRYDTNLWDAAFNTTGDVTLDLNAAGVAVIQDWLGDSRPNYGLTVQNYSGSDQDYWIVASKENTSGYTKPILHITYCLATEDPMISITSSMTGFSAPVNEYSAEQSYTVTGANLTEDITVNAPTNFEVSSTGGGSGFSGTVSLPLAGGTVYVRFRSTTAGSIPADITHTSTGVTENLSVSGTAYNVYTLTVGNDGNGTVTLDPAGGSYPSGTTVTLTPVPNQGYVFKDWTGTNAGDIVDTAGVYTIVMSGNKAVTANFEVSSTIYRQVNSITDGEKYIIAALDTAIYHAIKQNTTEGSSYVVDDMEVTVIDGAAYGYAGTNVIVDPGNESIIWEARETSGQMYFYNDDYNLYAGRIDQSTGASTQDGLIDLHATDQTTRLIDFSGTTMAGVSSFSGNYYFTYDGGFNVSTTEGDAAAIYIFAEEEVVDQTVTIAAIPGVTAPAIGETPVSTITETDQYTGTVTWDPDHNPFQAAKVYTAIITLTPKAGYTLTGVAADFFTVTGATTVSNDADSGVVTAVFPETGAVPPDTFSIDLEIGWNLVSFNLIPEDDAIEVILADILTDVILVYYYDASDTADPWKLFDPDALPIANDLDSLDETMGFWINMAQAATLTVSGSEPDTTDIPLYVGWNLIGYPSGDDDEIPGALDDIDEDYSLILAYHADDTDDPWKLYDPDAPGYANDLDAMAPGWGYWIYITSPGTWSIGY